MQLIGLFKHTNSNHAAGLGLIKRHSISYGLKLSELGREFGKLPQTAVTELRWMSLRYAEQIEWPGIASAVSHCSRLRQLELASVLI